VTRVPPSSCSLVGSQPHRTSSAISSRALADRFHVLSPDYPGFGNTDTPDPKDFRYTFDRLSEIVEGLLEKTGFTRSDAACEGCRGCARGAWTRSGFRENGTIRAYWRIGVAREVPCASKGVSHEHG